MTRKRLVELCTILAVAAEITSVPAMLACCRHGKAQNRIQKIHERQA